MTDLNRWRLGLGALGATVFFIAALLSPGRIDIVDGQTRYEVARSLLEHGDTKIRDERVWFSVFPGRSGDSYSRYQLPQSLLGVPFLALADWTGTRFEARRHFFYLLVSALAAASLAICYAVWFRHRGLDVGKALAWGLTGVLCTPILFYSTSTFDDVLCAATVVAAFLFSSLGRGGTGRGWLVAAGLTLGLAFHCKEPMGAFLFAVVGAGLLPGRRLRDQRGARLTVLVGLALGIGTYAAIELYKFPPDTWASHQLLMYRYVPTWPGHPTAAFFGLLLSPGKGMIWYCPAMLLGLAGLKAASSWERRGLAASVALYLAFFLSISYFSGDPSWGPRYLLPIFALLWLYVPWGFRALGATTSVLILVAGLVVQAESVTVDPHRLYVERGLPSAFYYERPWLYFHPAISHLWNRPREIVEIASRDRPPALFSPSPSPTFAFPVIDYVERGPRAVQRYAVLDCFRPWWRTLRQLPQPDRPVDLGRALAVQLSGLFLGGLLLVWSAAAGGSHPLRQGRPGDGEGSAESHLA